MVKTKKNSRGKLLLFIVVGILILSVAGFFVYKKVTNKNTVTAGAKTTSDAPSAQESYNSGGDRPISTNNSDKGSAAVTDSQGQQTASTDKSQWSTSKTGEITVYSPAKDKLLTKGDTVSGTSTLSIVYYRVLDDVSGMISQGQLSVVGGKFSGSVSFNTKAATGRLDFYGADDSGKEFGNVEIPVRFK